MLKRDNKGRFIKGNLGYWTGKHRDKDTQKKMKKTQFKKGQIAWNKNLKGIHFSPKTEFNGELKYWLGKTFSEKHRERLSKSHKGEKGSNWKGGISKEPYAFEFDKQLKKLSEEIANLSEERNELRAKWKSEKDIVDKIQKNKQAIENYKFEAEQAERSGDYGKVAEIRYGKIKEAENENRSL